MTSKIDQDVVLLVALYILLLVSCSPGPQAGGGIGGTGRSASIASGPITGFGSVFVSGKEYDTRQTSMTVDGKPGSQRDLKKGMVVYLDATLTEHDGITDSLQRTANTLLYEDTVEGVVQSVAQDGAKLVVLGQSITMTATTIIDPSILDRNVLNLVPGRDLVEISGFVTGDGTIVGTFVELKTIGSKTETADYEVKGFIKNHDADRKIFEIGSLTVNYRDAALKDMPTQPKNVWNGLLVDVRGIRVLLEGFGSNRVSMNATMVKAEMLSSEDREDTGLEGFVTQVLGPGDFVLGHVHVLTNVSTIFEGGTLDDIALGAHLEVHGPLISGVVRATKVEFESDNLRGAVTKVVTPSDFFIGDVRVLTNASTIFEGGIPNDIVVGAYLEVSGVSVGGIVNATKVEFEREA